MGDINTDRLVPRTYRLRNRGQDRASQKISALARDRRADIIATSDLEKDPPVTPHAIEPYQPRASLPFHATLRTAYYPVAC